MAVGLVKIADRAAVGGDEAIEVPITAKDVVEEHLVGAGGNLVDAVVGAHDGIGFAFNNRGAERGQVGVPEIVRGGIDVSLVAGGLGTAMNGVVLGSRDGAEVFVGARLVPWMPSTKAVPRWAVRNGSSP